MAETLNTELPFAAGQAFRIQYPFVRTTYDQIDEDGISSVPTWRPGCNVEPAPPYGEDNMLLADAVGGAVFTVVDCFKPGRFPMRVFFTRQFVDPDGKTFGKGKLHIATVEKFRRLTRGYHHEYDVVSDIEPARGAA